jgi:hypothetical protein
VADLTALLALAALLAGTAWLTWAITRNHVLNRTRNHLNWVTADRGRLLAALGHLTRAVNDPTYSLERAVQAAEKALDGRWTP